MTSEKSDPPAVDSFAALFEQTKTKTPRRRTPRVGDTVEAVVVQVGKESVFVETDEKCQAFIEAEELRAPDGTMTVTVGEVIRARVVEVDGDSVRLGRSLGKPGSVAAIEQARESGMAIEGKVTGINKGGLEVEIGGSRAFCPMSQADRGFLQDPSTLLNKTLLFAVTDVRDGGKSIVVSRRAVLEREAQDSAAKVMKDIVPGAVLRGTVTGVREFGAFVDLGGVEGLIPMSEMSHDRSVSAADTLSVGDVVEVQVRDVKDVADERRRGERTKKITLSLKALAKSPWEDIDALVAVGKVASGTVTRVVDFGAFVRIAAGIEGLLHVSELGGKVEHPGSVLKVGQSIAVVVKSIDKAEKRISLVPAPDGLAAGASVSALKIAVGAIVTGVVDRIETYGVFLQIDGSKGRAGRGLIPSAELGVQRGVDLRKTFPEGTKLTAKVLETGDGRLRLSLRAVKDDEERADFEGFREKTAASSKMGTFGDLLKKRK